MRIRPLLADDVERVREVDRAASRLFAAIGMHDIAAHEPTPTDEVLAYQRGGRAWVAADDLDRPLAFVLVDVVDGSAHVEQISVHPDVGRQGVGRLLLDTVAAWAAAEPLAALTLVTFRDVAWNRPYYERLGFHPIAEADIGPGLRAVRDAEAAKGLDPATRVCMRRDLPPPEGSPQASGGKS